MTVATRAVGVVVLVALCLVAVGPDSGGSRARDPHRAPGQPVGLAYADATGLADWARPGALVLAGRSDYADPGMVGVARGGGHVLVYLDAIILNPEGRYHRLLFQPSACGGAVGPWPGLPQANRWGSLADFRPGSELQRKLECVLEAVATDNPHVAGFFADDLGSRSYFPGLDWDSWTPQLRRVYRDGAVELSRTFRRVADRHGLLVVVNGTWHGGNVEAVGGGYPDPGRTGNALADGGMVEHHDGQERVFGPYLCSPQWAQASPVTQGRPVGVVLTSTGAARDAYLRTGCAAYVGVQDDYARVPPPWGRFGGTGLPSGAR